VNATLEKVEKVVKQIDKLVEVLRAFYHTEEEIIHQEVALYKVPTDALMNSSLIEKTVRKHNARILEITPEYTVLEKTGHKNETQQLFDELRQFNVKQFTRSGRIAITRLNREYLTDYLKQIDNE
jgi:acetolactate synthase I/III small subunit